MDRNKVSGHATPAIAASPPHGGVDRNISRDSLLGRDGSSPPHGGVDRNGAPAVEALVFGGRPLTGAWIETTPGACSMSASPSRPLTGAWIETRATGGCRRPACRRPLTGAWIETRCSTFQCPESIRSPPHGGVDRNVPARIDSTLRSVAPSRGRGSKLRLPRDLPGERLGRPLTGAWIETRHGDRRWT